MTTFIRVKSAKRRDPQHKFDVSEAYAKAHPELYKIVDPEPVSVPRPVEYAKGAEENPATISGSELPMHTADPVIEPPK